MNFIKDIRIYPIKPTSKGLIAFASCNFNNVFLSSIALYTNPDGSGYRLVYPDRSLPNGKKTKTFYPIDRETGKQIGDAIIEEFERITEGVSYAR